MSDDDVGFEHLAQQWARRINRRRFLELAGTAAAGAALVGCSNTTQQASPSGSATAKGGFKLINFFTTEDDPNTQAVVTSAAEDFSGKHPGVEITQILMSNADRDQRVLTGLSVGQDLGLFEIGAPYRGAFIDAGYLYPLDSLIKDIGEDQFVTGTRVVVNGHDYVFPYGGGPISMWYRTDRVSSAPQSFDDLLAAAQHATGGGNYGVAAATGGFGPVDYEFPPFVWSQGTDYFDKHGNVLFGNDKVTQAINNYISLLKYAPKDNTNWTFYSLIQAYVSGRVGMSFYPGRLGVNLPTKAPQLEGITKVAPAAFGPAKTNQWRWSYLAIDKTTKNPELAMEFIKFLLTGDNGVAYANSVPGQLIPSIKSVRDATLNDTKNDFVQKHKDWLQTLYSQIDSTLDISGPMGSMASGTLQPYNGPPAPWAAQAWGIKPVDMQMIQKITLENMPVKDAQNWATQQLQSIVSDYKSRHPNWRPPAG